MWKKVHFFVCWLVLRRQQRAILNDGEVIGSPSLNKGVVFQDYGLFPWMTAGENIMLALKQKFPKRDKKELKEIAINMIKAVGLDEAVYKKLPGKNCLVV